jgi:hypothetical protein
MRTLHLPLPLHLDSSTHSTHSTPFHPFRLITRRRQEAEALGQRRRQLLAKAVMAELRAALQALTDVSDPAQLQRVAECIQKAALLQQKDLRKDQQVDISKARSTLVEHTARLAKEKLEAYRQLQKRVKACKKEKDRRALLPQLREAQATALQALLAGVSCSEGDRHAIEKELSCRISAASRKQWEQRLEERIKVVGGVHVHAEAQAGSKHV